MQWPQVPSLFRAHGGGQRFRVALRVQVPHNQVLGILVIVIIVQGLSKYMIIKYLDPQGLGLPGKPIVPLK